MKLFDCLPNDVGEYLQNFSDIRELRIRNGCAVRLNVGGYWYYLGSNGKLVRSVNLALTAGKICNEIVKKACASSIYAYEKSLASGYFTLDDGVRVGVCGDMNGSDRKVFQQYTSLCFRVPHYVKCVTDEAFNKFEKNNSVIIGAPSSGKTTLLRDIAVRLGPHYNVLVVDERGELFYDESLTASSCCDVLKWSDKLYAFDVGVRSMSPQYIICDELSEADIPFVKSCVNSGIKLICSAHASCKKDFDDRFKLLDRFGYVVDLNVKASF